MRNVLYFLSIVVIFVGLDTAFMQGRMLEAVSLTARDVARGIRQETLEVTRRLIGEDESEQ